MWRAEEFVNILSYQGIRDCWSQLGQLQKNLQELNFEEIFTHEHFVDTLIETDLLKKRASQVADFALKESEINFLPTYKIDENTGTYKLYKKTCSSCEEMHGRLPGYADRILYTASFSTMFESGNFKTKYYPLRVKGSDHFPVCLRNCCETDKNDPNFDSLGQLMLISYNTGSNLKGVQDLIERINKVKKTFTVIVALQEINHKIHSQMVKNKMFGVMTTNPLSTGFHLGIYCNKEGVIQKVSPKHVLFHVQIKDLYKKASKGYFSVQCKLHDHEFTVINTHCPFKNESASTEAWDMLNTAVKGKSAVVLGDFNSRSMIGGEYVKETTYCHTGPVPHQL